MPHGQFAPLLSLAAHWHSCEGEVPPPMVGASLTLVDSGPHAGQAYLFGGRLASTRKLTNDLYELNLTTLRWRKLFAGSEADDAPGPSSPSSSSSSPFASSSKQPIQRYFHSCDLWKNKLVVFGGMGFHKDKADGGAGAGAEGSKSADKRAADPQASLFVLNEVIAFDLDTGEWDLGFDKSSAASSSSSFSNEAEEEETKLPDPRYAHLSSLTGSSLVIIGGQSASNQYIQEINVFDLEKRRWTLSHQFLKMCGSYRSLAAGPKLVVQSPKSKDAGKANGDHDHSLMHAGVSASASAAARNRAGSIASSALSKSATSDATSSNAQRLSSGSHAPSMAMSLTDYLPMSVRPTAEDGTEEPLPVFVYSNYNFTDVKRELELVRLPSAIPNGLLSGRDRRASSASEDSELDGEVSNPLAAAAAAAAATAASTRPGAAAAKKRKDITIEDRSFAMTGTSFPPGLRFPTGAVLGNHFIISGTYLANTSQTFAIWALNTTTMVWTRLDVGSSLTQGSWNRAVLWPSQNRLVVFGNRQRDLVADYNHRQSNFDDIVVIELEAWGIHQAPMRPVGDNSNMEMGLEKLMASAVGSLGAALGARDPVEELASPLSFGGRGDFEIVCSDGMRLGCDRIVLEKRWPWFLSKIREYKTEARRVARNMSSSSSRRRTDQLKAVLESDEEDDEGEDDERQGNAKVPLHRLLPLPGARGNDPRLLPRQLVIGEPAPVMLALLQFFYTRCICTALQRHPAVVAALLIAAKVYQLDELQRWAKHAAHVCLSTELSVPVSSSDANSAGGTPTSAVSATHDRGLAPMERHRLAVVIYETATMCGHEALQIRALRIVMSVSKWVQRTSSHPHAALDGKHGLSHATPVMASATQGPHDGETGMMSPAVNETPAIASMTWSSMGREEDVSSSGMPHPAEIMLHHHHHHPADSASEAPSETDTDTDLSGARNTSSKIERMLGISAGQQLNGNALSKAERTLGIEAAPSRQQQQQQQQALPGSTSSRLIDQRRPSATQTSSMLSVKTSSTSSSSRKRFSIFGRSTSDKLPPSPTSSERQLVDAEGQRTGATADSRNLTRVPTGENGQSYDSGRTALPAGARSNGVVAGTGAAAVPQGSRSTKWTGSGAQASSDSPASSSPATRVMKVPAPIQTHRRPSVATKGSPRFRDSPGPSTPTSTKSGQLSENDKAILHKMSSFV
ncbi:hypothetical protein FA10DRAFT_264725 [Acaromyces ingoldii]|uniref:Galactose oxidase n=1 Tax=Acaromyces ingoldii TaxID=215250 RepID=A0A316YYM4_9BASI|nr:hypothetical protein FA10DRAFT_264725 [Acaromyces ingoldii]PWN94156.1 hypothetical protein FA10DRAFT_264725 [Acaromyces ingoldii]